MNKKSYGFKSKNGNVASVTFEGNKKPSEKTLEALSTMIDLAYTNLKPNHQPNNKPMNLFDNDNGASFSEDRKYRYSLWRIWDKTLPLVMFIGLNPSTANESTDDATIRRVKTIAANLGYGGVYMMNCFVYISTDPKGLVIDIISCCLNDNLLIEVSKKCKDVIFAWGNFDVVKTTGRDAELIEMFPNAKALQINKNGSPKHPLYCKSDIQPILFKPNS